jgi:hypothetical protein
MNKDIRGCIAKLEFPIPEEEDSFKLACRGKDFFCALHEIKNLIRNFKKHGTCDLEGYSECLKQIILEIPTELMDDIS